MRVHPVFAKRNWGSRNILKVDSSLYMQHSFLYWLQRVAHGFFKGKRGLRHGDPLSPYLFVLAMNFFYISLNKPAEDGRFSYHFKCKEAKLTHLCFADDLLIFVEGNQSAVQEVLDILQDFKEKSSLAISIPKTFFFSSGLSPAESSQISSTTGLAHALLSVRYLGVALCTRKLSMANCTNLIQR